MLDSFIIEELRRREEERRRELERPRLELPLHPERDPRAEDRDRDRDEESSRGVVVIDL
jgi:hypothetical protein